MRVCCPTHGPKPWMPQLSPGLVDVDYAGELSRNSQLAGSSRRVSRSRVGGFGEDLTVAVSAAVMGAPCPGNLCP